MALIQRNETQIARVSREMGVGDYRLFASMLTARSWDGMEAGLHAHATVAEHELIQSQLASRAPSILDILQTVPSELLLLLKTNDLLRSLNEDLGMPVSSSISSTLKHAQVCVHNHRSNKSM